MSDDIYRFVSREPPSNDVTPVIPKLLGAPRMGKRDVLEARFERERVFHELAAAVHEISLDVRRLIPALGVRAVPLPKCQGAKLVCEIYSGSYSVYNEAVFSESEMQDLPRMRKRVGRMIAHTLTTVASQVEYAASR